LISLHIYFSKILAVQKTSISKKKKLVALDFIIYIASIKSTANNNEIGIYYSLDIVPCGAQLENDICSFLSISKLLTLQTSVVTDHPHDIKRLPELQ
jgi:hypothetical protein